jgi:hypothetical protein
MLPKAFPCWRGLLVVLALVRHLLFRTPRDVTQMLSQKRSVARRAFRSVIDSKLSSLALHRERYDAARDDPRRLSEGRSATS